MRSQHVYYLCVFTILVATALLAAASGFISPDSWNYLLMAQSLRHGEGCAVSGQYFATFPCGYPIAIALTAPSGDIASLLVSSKFTNLVLLTASFALLLNALPTLLPATFIIVNPITLDLFQWTWSENLFLFACCGTLFAIGRLAQGKPKSLQLVLLAAFLIIGSLSRYFFGPFAALVFVAIWIAYGRSVALSALPAFVVAGLVFVGNQAINSSITGYATGMPRIPAPETPLWLTVKFLQALGSDALVAGAALLVLLSFSVKQIAARGLGNRLDAAQKSASVYLLLTGAGFLALAYVLRLATQYDLYDTRTVGYGVIFIAAGIAGLFDRPASGAPYPLSATLACGSFALGYLPRGLLSDAALCLAIALMLMAINHLLRERRARSFGMLSLVGCALLLTGYWQRGPILAAIRSLAYLSTHPVALAIAGYRSPATDARTVYAFAVPMVGPQINSSPRLYYGDKKVVTPTVGPQAVPETLRDFTAKLHAQGPDGCVFDFHSFTSLAEFTRYLDKRYPVDANYADSWLEPETRYQPAFDPALRSYLLQVFQPGRYVPCSSPKHE